MTRAIENSYYDIKENEEELSKNDLMFFKEALEEKKEKIQKSLDEATQESMTTHNRCRDEGDSASLEVTNHVNAALYQKQNITLNKINRSLNKIAIGTYGTCSGCEEPINIERLKIQMFTEYCVSCRELMEKQK